MTTEKDPLNEKRLIPEEKDELTSPEEEEELNAIAEKIVEKIVNQWRGDFLQKRKKRLIDTRIERKKAILAENERQRKNNPHLKFPDTEEKESMYTANWWEHITPEESTKRDILTGLYRIPLPGSKVIVSQNHHLVSDWMLGVRGVVIGSLPPEPIKPLIREPKFDKEGNITNERECFLFDKDGKNVRMPGIPLVEVSFPEEDYDNTYFIPANCLEEEPAKEPVSSEGQEDQKDPKSPTSALQGASTSSASELSESVSSPKRPSDEGSSSFPQRSSSDDPLSQQPTSLTEKKRSSE